MPKPIDYTRLPTLEGKAASEIRELIEAGRVFAETRRGSFCEVRLNGKTQTWKRQPGYFSIPTKIEMSTCFRIEPHNLDEFRVLHDPLTQKALDEDSEALASLVP